MDRLNFPCRFFAISALLISGCASIPADLGSSDVAKMAANRGRVIPAGDTATLTQQLLAQPLSAESAVTLGLINNPAVRIETSRLGFAAADVYDAARIANPVLSASRLVSNNPAAVSAQLGLGVAVSFTDLLFLPARNRFAKARFEAAKQSVSQAALTLAAQIEGGYYRLAGAEQSATMREIMSRASQRSATLAQRFFDAGNISKRELALEQSAASQGQIDAISARAEAVAARQTLNRLMGLSEAQSTWQLATGLPAPLAQEDTLEDLLKMAATSRLDVAAARKNVEAIADAYGFERNTRFVGTLAVGYQREKETDGSAIRGPSLDWQIPLFNWGSGRIARAKAALNLAEGEQQSLELDVSSQVRSAYVAVQTAKANAERYRTTLIPQREAVVSQTQREVNYMLIGVFELILAKQQEYDAYGGYLNAVRDYWITRAELARAVGRRLPSSEQLSAETLNATKLSTPKDTGMGGMMNMKGMQGMEGMSGMSGMNMGASEQKASKPGSINSMHAIGHKAIKHVKKRPHTMTSDTSNVTTETPRQLASPAPIPHRESAKPNSASGQKAVDDCAMSAMSMPGMDMGVMCPDKQSADPTTTGTNKADHKHSGETP